MKRALTVAIFSAILAVLIPQTSWANDSGHSKSKSEGAYSSHEVVLIKKRDTLRVAGINALYNIEYDQAQSIFEQIVSLDPEHPAGYIYQAVNIWLRHTHNTRRLHTSMFNNAEFNYDIIDGPMKIDENLDRKFYTLLNTAREKSEVRLKKNKKDIDALYFLAAAYSTQAAYEATVSNKYLAAMRSSSKAIDINKKVLKLDPTIVDAQLTGGIYDYVVANLPLAIRMMGSIFGLRGNEGRGIAALERVAKEGRYNSDDARLVLVTIYQREKRYDDSFRVLQELQERHPKNCLPQLERAALLIRINRKEEAFKTFEQLMLQEDMKPSLDLIRFHYGDALLASGKFEDATKQYLAVTELSGDRQLKTLAHFRAGQAFDMAKSRDRAVEQYRKVLGCENAFNIHERAKEYLRRPYEMSAK